MNEKRKLTVSDDNSQHRQDKQQQNCQYFFRVDVVKVDVHAAKLNKKAARNTSG
jgi:hypothetical protein